MNRYYFRIPDAQVFEVIEAEHLLEAKAKAFDEWVSLWHRIEWVTPETHAEVKLPNA